MKVDHDSYFSSNALRQIVKNKFDMKDSEYIRIRPHGNDYNHNCILYFNAEDIPISLDLHGFTRDTAYNVLNNFISEAINSNLNKVRIVHGRSGQVIPKIVYDYFNASNYKFDKDIGHVDVTLTNSCNKIWTSFSEFKSSNKPVQVTNSFEHKPVVNPSYHSNNHTNSPSSSGLSDFLKALFSPSTLPVKVDSNDDLRILFWLRLGLASIMLFLAIWHHWSLGFFILPFSLVVSLGSTLAFFILTLTLYIEKSNIKFIFTCWFLFLSSSICSFSRLMDLHS